ncbi:hypothetical protein [Nostoc sp. FACHB-892]|uniref:tetratricopeptide repeat protein n=1 Tax=Nostoc sp. FACHB-892 TaxID=2692843 RepID=UPI001F54DC58|nr:hypothetical protein [Nostoc sp. FACHB-892]
MKKSIKFLTGFCLSFLLIKDTLLLAGVPLARTRRNQVRCELSGRLISPGDKRLQAGSLVCDGEKIEVLNGGRIKFFCFSTGEILDLSSGVVSSDICAKPDLSKSACYTGNGDFCSRTPKGRAEGNDEPTIIYPYVMPTLKPRPEIVWLPVTSATYYKVRFDCYDFSWERVINQTRLAYPSEEKPLASGQTCQILVFAYKEDKITGGDPSVISLLPQNEVAQIKDAVNQISKLKLPPDEAALDFDAIFMSRDLLDETIEQLNNVVSVGTKNPTVYRVLGDRYFQAGVLDQAKRQYLKASELVKTSNNSTELRKVQEGLKLVDYYNQLPTSR